MRQGGKTARSKDRRPTASDDDDENMRYRDKRLEGGKTARSQDDDENMRYRDKKPAASDQVDDENMRYRDKRPKSASTKRRLSMHSDFEQIYEEGRNDCVICMAARPNIALVPCGHLCLCVDCLDSFLCIKVDAECPICREGVIEPFRIYY
jgi:hypothetical protein